MVIAAEPDATNNAAADFPAIFRAYIVNSVQAVLADIAQSDAILTTETRDRALHALSFALKRDLVWPSTRDLLLLLAPKLEQAGHRDDWLPYLEAGVTLSQACADPGAEAELRLQIGHLHYLCSSFDLAEQQLSTSLTIFNSLDDTYGQARTYNELAWLSHLQHSYAEAAYYVEQALALLSDEDTERAMSYRVQGMIAIDQIRWQEAETFHRQALMLFEKQGDQRRIAWSMQNLAYTLRGQARFKEALLYCQQAAKMLDQVEDTHSFGIAQMTLGTIYYLLNEPSKAVISYKQAEIIFNGLYDKLNIAKIRTGLGLGYLALKEYTEAEIAFLSSIRFFAEVKDESLRLNATDGLVMTYLASEQYDQAIEVAEQALRELSSITSAPNYAYLVQSLNQHLAEARQGQGLTI